MRDPLQPFMATLLDLPFELLVSIIELAYPSAAPSARLKTERPLPIDMTTLHESDPLLLPLATVLLRSTTWHCHHRLESGVKRFQPWLAKQPVALSCIRYLRVVIRWPTSGYISSTAPEPVFSQMVNVSQFALSILDCDKQYTLPSLYLSEEGLGKIVQDNHFQALPNPRLSCLQPERVRTSTRAMESLLQRLSFSQPLISPPTLYLTDCRISISLAETPIVNSVTCGVLLNDYTMYHGLEFLTKLPFLRQLYLHWVDGDIGQIRHNSLEELYISACDNSTLPETFKSLPNLRHLSADWVLISDFNLFDSLESLSNLETLQINFASNLRNAAPGDLGIVLENISRTTLQKKSILPLLRRLTIGYACFGSSPGIATFEQTCRARGISLHRWPGPDTMDWWDRLLPMFPF